MAPAPLPRPPSFRALALPLLLVAGTVSIYLLLAWRLAGVLAFPLDDAWIHQTYARTFSEGGGWGFRAGEPSSGSTGPLWTLLLVPGHLLPLSPVLWSHLLGVACWLAVILLGGRLTPLLFPGEGGSRWVMLALAAEWHLVWAALSGMELMLYMALLLALLVLYLSRRGDPFTWGLVGGLLTVTRPEGALLLALLGVHYLGTHGRNAAGGLARLAAGWMIPGAPYLLFNWYASGQLFPNTFYAKQEEYALLLASIPLWRRVATVAWQPWIGGQFLLLPFLPFLRQRRAGMATWLPLLWAGGIVLLYALRLPVTYQHGRYLMPTIPIFLLYGVVTFRHLLHHLWPALRPATGTSILVAFGLFVPLGALAYGSDVALIECEMGGSAQWIATNSRLDDLIAAHDIGRLGYTARRPILDLAGLISPEVVPIIRDEEALLDLVQASGARYLVTFADWYPGMVRDPRLQPRYSATCPQTRQAGHAPMTIYQVEPPPGR